MFALPPLLRHAYECTTSWHARPLRGHAHPRRLFTPQAREEFDVRVMQLAKARREGATKTIVGRGGAARQEARLDSRKHRATSRRAQKQALWQQQAGGDGDDDDDGGDLL